MNRVREKRYTNPIRWERLHSTEHVNQQRGRDGLQIEINAIKQQSVNDRFVRNIS